MSSVKISFLGTCACDFSPKLENEFKNKFDYNARRASSVLLEESYLIDAGNHILDSLRISNTSVDKITNIFISHLHDDHFDLNNIIQIAKQTKAKLKLWVRENAKIEENEAFEIIKMIPYKRYEVEKGMYITGLDANHDQSSCPQHLLIEMNNKKIFYGCDGAWLLANTYNLLKGSNLDVAILDATIGDYDGDYRIAEHNSIPMIRLMLPTLRNERIITERTKIYLSHIAPSLHKPHCEIELIANELGANVAYDGLKMEV
jgi:ribonuclease BN (tRNA processing enzyme)